MIKALFLDRDGVINIDKHHLYKIEDFEFVDGIFDVCEYYQERGYIIIVVTNQAGIARGLYQDADFQKLSSWMIAQFRENGIEISRIYHCPHHPDFTGPCACRKPEPGMLLQAQKDFNIDLEASILIGDKQSDLDAGRAAGIQQLFLVNQ